MVCFLSQKSVFSIFFLNEHKSQALAVFCLLNSLTNNRPFLCLKINNGPFTDRSPLKRTELHTLIICFAVWRIIVDIITIQAWANLCRSAEEKEADEEALKAARKREEQQRVARMKKVATSRHSR